MEMRNGVRRRTQLPEENIMAILDLSGVNKQDDIEDDKLTFLAAVRGICIIPQTAQVPTRRMHKAVFQILRDNRSLELRDNRSLELRDERSLELTITSHQLLQDLEKCFPRVSVVEVKGLSPNNTKIELVINPQVWSPFAVICENDSDEMEDPDYIDCSKLCSLTQVIAKQVCDGDSTSLGGGPELYTGNKQPIHIFMAKMMMFEYLVTLLKKDFICRSQVFKVNQEWPIIHNACLNQLLASQRTIFRNLVKQLLYIMAATTRESPGINHDTECNSDKILKKPLSKLELEAQFRHTLCQSAEMLLTLIMELDALKKETNQKGWTSRSDGYRTHALEIVIDELSYNKELISPFLEAMTEVKWKTNIILTFFLKHCPRSMAKTFESNIEENTIKDLFNCFSNLTNVRSISKGINEDVIQLLFLHGFQAYFAIQQDVYRFPDGADEASLKETCESFITAFKNLRSTYKRLKLIAGGREALITAETIIS